MPPSDIPRIGLGTWPLTGEECVDAVETALELGYRHLDTAQMYENEVEVGEGLVASGVPREDVFVATKINHRSLPAGTYEDVMAAVDESLDRLGLDTLDVLYVHWPVGDYDPDETLRAFDDLYAAGTIDHVGLSNCTPAILEEAIEHLESPLLAHQVEMHPLLKQEELHRIAVREDHWLVAYSPLAHGGILEAPEIREIARAHGIRPAQVSLAWLTGKENVAAIPNSSSPAHLRENLSSLEVSLDPGAIARIDAIEREDRFLDPDGAPWNAG